MKKIFAFLASIYMLSSISPAAYAQTDTLSKEIIPQNYHYEMDNPSISFSTPPKNFEDYDVGDVICNFTLVELNEKQSREIIGVGEISGRIVKTAPFAATVFFENSGLYTVHLYFNWNVLDANGRDIEPGGDNNYMSPASIFGNGTMKRTINLPEQWHELHIKHISYTTLEDGKLHFATDLTPLYRY